MCPGTRKENAHEVWESDKILEAQSIEACRSGGVWVRGAVPEDDRILQVLGEGMQGSGHRSLENWILLFLGLQYLFQS